MTAIALQKVITKTQLLEFAIGILFFMIELHLVALSQIVKFVLAAQKPNVMSALILFFWILMHVLIPVHRVKLYYNLN